MTLNPVSSEQLRTRLSGIIWGDAKTGKTTWAMSLPGRKLLINFDPDGFLSIAHRQDFDVFDLSTLPASEAIETTKKIGTYILDNADKYGSVIVDSLTTLTSLALEDAVSRGIGKSIKFTPTLETPGLNAYGARNMNVQNVLERIMRASGQKNLHCFFIAHKDDPEFDEDGKNIVQQTIMLSAKVRNNAALRVSEIYYLHLSSGNRRTVYLAPYGHLTPMGSRIFDTAKVPKFNLNYDPNKDDTQTHSLASLFSKFSDNGNAKLEKEP